MNRLCERPGCSAPAEVAYGFDADLLIVWLDALAAAQGMRFGVLCRRHADAMIVPLGWMLDDRREPTMRLFKAPAVEAPAPRPRPPRRSRRKGDEQLTLDSTVAAPAAVDDDAAVADVEDLDAIEAVAVIPEDLAEHAWVPVFDPHDDLHGLLKARGRLLSRAFNGAPTRDA
jgi:hypothetical protein